MVFFLDSKHSKPSGTKPLFEPMCSTINLFPLPVGFGAPVDNQRVSMVINRG